MQLLLPSSIVVEGNNCSVVGILADSCNFVRADVIVILPPSIKKIRSLAFNRFPESGSIYFTGETEPEYEIDPPPFYRSTLKFVYVSSSYQNQKFCELPI